MEEILARARQVAEEAEVYSTSVMEIPVQFESNRLKHIQTRQSQMVALRLIKNGKFGYATTTQLDNYEDLIENALATAEFGSQAEFHFPSNTDFPKVDIIDTGVEKITLEQMTGLGEEMIAALIGHTPELICEGGVSRAVIELNIANSRGGKAGFRQTIFGLGIEGQLTRGTDMLFVGDYASSCHPILEPKEIIDTVIRQLELAKQQASISTGQMTVIFTPEGVAGSIIPSLMTAFNGKTVLEGASPIGNKLEQTVFDTKLTVRDDPSIPYRPGSRPCDDEGIPCQPTPLITAGMVNNFLYDLQTAARANKKSTGNGHRSPGGLPGPSPHAFVIQGGKTGFEAMVKNIDEGLVVEQLMGAGQGNVLGGDFSGNVLLGFKIEKGNIVGRVKDTMVSGNIFQLLKNISVIGSDSKWVGSSLWTPSLCFENVSVTSK